MTGWKLIASQDCRKGNCPAVFAISPNVLGIQGPVADRTAPEGEAIVEIPVDLLKEAVRALGW